MQKTCHTRHTGHRAHGEWTPRKQVPAASTCAAMEGPGRPVVLYRARTPGERQHVVLAVQKHWGRVGQRPREHLLVWDTEDGLPPIDAQLEDTAEAFKALPWFHKAAIGDGGPYSYHSAVRDLDDLEVDEAVLCNE
jgi:hypothetical protein